MGLISTEQAHWLIGKLGLVSLANGGKAFKSLKFSERLARLSSLHFGVCEMGARSPSSGP